ncbi:MAG: flagellar basal body-associated protein FliL [Steroidobacteraceae bacterium]
MSDTATPAAPVAGGSNKMMFIMMGAMFILLLGGMGGMYVMLSKSSAQGQASQDQASTEHGEGNKDEKHEAKSAAIYVSFEPPFVVNFPVGGDVKFLQLTVQAMTRDEIMEKDMQRNSPAIRDALLTLFGQQTAEGLSTSEGKEQLRAKALEAVRAVMKSEGKDPAEIEGIYFTSFVMQ